MALLVLGFALLCFFIKSIRKFRIVLLVSSIFVLGFMNGTLLSLFTLYSWTIGGISLQIHWFLVMVVFISIAIPLFMSKSFYCDYLCPYGAAQELVGKLNKKKHLFPFSKYAFVKNLRAIILLIIIFLLVAGISIDLTNVEPFTAFVFASASVFAIVSALVFLVLSLFYNKPWCNYFCPTGEILHFFK